jgi:HPt (histidine-containing phosphotransfer) domain-containing protein
MTADRARCIAAGMDDYLAKPVQVEDLVSALERWAPLDGSLPFAVVTDSDGAVADDTVEADEQVSDLDPAIVGGLRDLGGIALLDELVSLFHDEVGRYLSDLDRALADDDPVALRQTSHALSGSSANMGAQRVAAAAGALEQLAASGNLDGAQALITELATNSRRALEALARETGQPQGTADIDFDPSSTTLPRGSK